MTRANWLESLVLIVSVVAVLAVVGFLVVDGFLDDGRPPEPVITLRHENAYASDGGWFVPADVFNRGDSAAEAVVLRATATVADTEEESEVTLDYLPAGTRVAIAFAFSAEPDGDVSVHPVGFRLP